MKTNSNNLRKAQIIMDCAMIAIFAIPAVMFLIDGRHVEAAYNLLLALAWLLILMKDRLIGHYVKLVGLYKEMESKYDEYINYLVGVLYEKQKDNDTDNQ